VEDSSTARLELGYLMSERIRSYKRLQLQLKIRWVVKEERRGYRLINSGEMGGRDGPDEGRMSC
jgi:hypothetical protein